MKDTIATPAIPDLRARLTERHHLSSLWLSRRGRGVVVVDLIAVEEGARGLGHGEAALGELTAWADETGTTLELVASDDYGSDPARLVAWYGRHGFAGDGERLVRAPREPRH